MQVQTGLVMPLTPRTWDVLVRRVREFDMLRVWSLGGLTKRDLARAVVRNALDHDLPGRAAQLSYYFLLAIFPSLIFISALLGYAFAAEKDLHARLLIYMGAVMPWSAYELLRGTVNDIIAGASGGKMSVGLILAFWTGSTGMVAVIEGLNIAYRVPEKRPWWRRRIVALILTVGMGALAAIAMMLIVTGDSIEALIASLGFGNHILVTASALVKWSVAICSMLAALLVVYRFAPNLPDQGIEAVLPGALVALIGWLVASSAFRIYLAAFDSFSRTYGSLGAVMVLLLWLYLSAGSILAGGEVNSAIREALRQRRVDEPTRR